MDLKTFVAETLSQITQGIREAQKIDGTGSIAPKTGAYMAKEVKGIFPAAGGSCTTVDFDVSVLVGEREGGTTLRVSSMETTDRSSRTNENTSRVSFSVHLRLPSPH